MSTDKTLADAQPGGRVRLGDQAERARFEAFLSRNPLMALCAGTAWQVWQAALSAQPSPGGQDEQRIVVRVPGVGQCTLTVNDGAIDIPAETIAGLAALTPPEGYVLVDAKLLGAVRVARLAILQKQAEAEQADELSDASMWADCAADLDAIAPRGMLAARPEVKP